MGDKKEPSQFFVYCELEELGINPQEISIYNYLANRSARELMNPASISKSEIRQRFKITSQEVGRVLDALENKYRAIEVQGDNLSGGRGKRLDIYIIPAKHYVRPEKVLEDFVENFEPDQDPLKWGTNDVVKYFMLSWERCYGVPYLANWGLDGTVVKRDMFGKLNLTGDQIKLIIDYLFDAKKGILFKDEKINSMKALGNLDIINGLLPEAVAYSKKKKRPGESPSVQRKREEAAKKENKK